MIILFILSLFIVSCGVRGPLLPPKKPMSLFNIGDVQKSSADKKDEKESKKDESK